MKDYRAGIKKPATTSVGTAIPSAYGNKFEARKAGMEAAKAGLSTVPEGFEAKYGKRLGRVNKRIAAAKKPATTAPVATTTTSAGAGTPASPGSSGTMPPGYLGGPGYIPPTPGKPGKIGGTLPPQPVPPGTKTNKRDQRRLKGALK